MHVPAEAVEALAGIKLDHLQAGAVFQDRRVGSKPEIHAFAAFAGRPLDEGLDEESVVHEVVDLPDHVISQA